MPFKISILSSCYHGLAYLASPDLAFPLDHPFDLFYTFSIEKQVLQINE